MFSELRYALLGPVRAWRGEAELDLGTPQQRAALAMLLLAEGRQVSLSVLIDALWGDEPPRAAAGRRGHGTDVYVAAAPVPRQRRGLRPA